MNTKNLKAYAPKARRQFMDAVAKRAAHFGIYPNEIAPVSFQGSTAIIEGNAFTKQQGEQRKLLETRIREKPLATHKERYELFVREMAYTWFNRLAALRFMELHDYLEHGFRVLSHPTNKDGAPEILDHAADVADMLGLDKAQIIEWQLAGDKQEVLYRELLLGQCHHLHSVMPFLFEAIDDATELLLPDNLTKTDSILKGLVNDIPEEDWQQIEVIGWLYQFYISEHKDAVIGKVVKSEDIPAATQLFTPNWIVKYLVQNSIGRQWLATYPDSSIKAKMEYYIEPAEQTDEVNAQLAAITPSSIDPESIKALDPAAGSGHILVEIYELLREIYLERGYRQREIPELILTKNIYGLDIDDRAAQLAGFALLMKAREDDRRIFQRVQDGSVKLNVYALQSTEGWDSASLWQALNLDGKAKQGSSGDLFAENAGFQQPTGQYAEYFELLKYLILSFKQAKTLGSLIQIDHKYLPTLKKFKDELLDKLRGTDPAAIAAASQLMPVIEQAIVLAQKYDAVIANPPYMGSKGMNASLKDFAKEFFLNSKEDLFAMFMERAFKALKATGLNAQVNMQSWMFLSKYESLREMLISQKTIKSLAHFGPRAFSQISGEVVQTVAWVIGNRYIEEYLTSFNRLVDGNEEEKKLNLRNNSQAFLSNQKYFLDIPGSPLIYWVPKAVLKTFADNPLLGSKFDVKRGMTTSNNEKFLRYWSEVSILNTKFDAKDSKEALDSGARWFPYSKGGGFRKWYGFSEYLVNWKDDGKDIIEYALTINSSYTRTIVNIPYYFKPSVGFPYICTGDFSMRWIPEGHLYDSGGPGVFADENSRKHLIGLMNSKAATYILKLLNPTVNLQIADVIRLPIPEKCNLDLSKIDKAIVIAKDDWDSYERSWDFKNNPLVKIRGRDIRSAYKTSVDIALDNFEEIKNIEEELNEVCIKAYALDSVLDSSVKPEQITLNNCSKQ